MFQLFSWSVAPFDVRTDVALADADWCSVPFKERGESSSGEVFDRVLSRSLTWSACNVHWCLLYRITMPAFRLEFLTFAYFILPPWWCFLPAKTDAMGISFVSLGRVLCEGWRDFQAGRWRCRPVVRLSGYVLDMIWIYLDHVWGMSSHVQSSLWDTIYQFNSIYINQLHPDIILVTKTPHTIG